ncbi:MAG: aspartate/glutamate racemase family protein [Ectothiorhodospiraceae bacterium]|nr:aspartate/glutamate racemase family protein [Ectothiorhodospiraceae bacterium]
MAVAGAGSVVARGGKAVYGASLGILMLEARFPRIPGDMGNGLTWPFPVLFEVVPGASPDRVVRRGAQGLLDAFVAAARRLVAIGADGITTNCGFLSPFQGELARACGVPVAASSLMQVPMVQRTLPAGRRVGILTVSAGTLTARHLAEAGCDPDTPVVGTDDGEEFTRVLLDDLPALDVDAARADLLAAADRLVREHPQIGAVVLECTNMCPYAADIRDHLGLPVYDMVTFATWFHGGLRPRRFPAP